MATDTKEFQVVEKTGDLFTCPETNALAHCISEDVRMGKGIAVVFKKKFGGVEELQKQKKTVGEVAVLKRDKRFIYYLITKKKANDKPTYNTLANSLKAMRDDCQMNKVKELSMPRIGCGLDFLKWNLVLPMIEDIFKDTGVAVTVYTLPS